jgi:NADH:ubiquinone oxidoreductase subunit E
MGCPGKCGNGPVLGLDGDEYIIVEEASEDSDRLRDIIEAEARSRD